MIRWEKKIVNGNKTKFTFSSSASKLNVCSVFWAAIAEEDSGQSYFLFRVVFASKGIFCHKSGFIRCRSVMFTDVNNLHKTFIATFLFLYGIYENFLFAYDALFANATETSVAEHGFFSIVRQFFPLSLFFKACLLLK